VEILLKIIEDSSPHYVRFTHDGLDKVVGKCQQILSTINMTDENFIHHRVSVEEGNEILSMIPFSKSFNFMQYRVSLFISKPGLYYRAHKDGLDHRFSINYPIQILDDKCVTSWYSDKDLHGYKIDTLNNKSRECIDFDKGNHTPTKTMTAKMGECILFNTDLFHDWDNTASDNYRVVLTLRCKNPGNIYFQEAKQILFKYL
jgi:hypothetical protein